MREVHLTFQMLTHITHGDSGPHIFLLHWLGGSARSWQWLSPALAAYGYRVTALDLPGFGDSAYLPAGNVTESAEQLLATLRELRATEPDEPWLLCGHSMGGKFASVVARTAQNGDPALASLRGLFLVSPSPPSPEPMEESNREHLIETLGNPQLDAEAFRKASEKFLKDNTSAFPLTPNIKSSALEDLRRLNRNAFRAWFTNGSLEDWSYRVGRLTLPAVVLAGNKEGPLGAKQQESLLPHYLPQATVVTSEGGGHLASLERPLEVADRIAAFAAKLGLTGKASQSLSPAFTQLLGSDNTSPQTRAVMQKRLEPASTPGSFTPDEMLTLRALVRAIVPSANPQLANRLAISVSAPQGNGWRFDDLPSPLEAWKRGLLSLDHAARSQFSVSFTALRTDAAATLLTHAGDGSLKRTLLDTALPGEDHATLTATRMQHWVEDVRGECAKLYVADPRTMDRIGFHGFADDHGFIRIRLEDQEPQ